MGGVEMQNKKYSVLFLGPENAGKSSLYNVLSDKELFSLEKKTYVSTRMAAKTYEGADVTVNYTDIGSKVNPKVTQKTVESASTKIVCLVFDANNEHWMTEINKFLNIGIEIPKDTSVLLIGNKIDTLDEATQLRLQSDAVKYMARYYKDRGQYIAVSAKTSQNIESLSTKIVDILSNETFSLDTAKVTARNFRKRRSLTGLEAQFEEDDDDLSSVGGSSIGGGYYRAPTYNGSVSDFGGTTSRSLLNGSSSAAGRPNLMQQAGYKPRFGEGQMLPMGPPVSKYKLAGEKTPDVSPTRTSPIRVRTPSRAGGTPNGRGNQPSTNSYFALDLQLAGMLLIMAALASLIYLAIVAAGLLSSVALTTIVTQIVTTIGGLVGMSMPAIAFGNLCAAWGLSTATGSGLVAATASLMTMGLGFSLRHLGSQPNSAANAADLTAAPTSTWSSALYFIGGALMALALVNIIYLIGIALHVFSTVALTAGMNMLLVTVGGVLGVTAPVAAFANASATVGLSATTAAGVLSATGSVLMAGIGYSMFRRSVPQPSELPGANDCDATTGRTSPLLEVRY